MQGRQTHRQHVKMAANSAKKSFESSSNFQADGYCLRRVWLERSANDRKAETSVVRRNGQKECRLASEKHRIGTKMVSEAIS